MGKVSQLLVNQLKRGEKKSPEYFCLEVLTKPRRIPLSSKQRAQIILTKKTKRQIEPKTNMLLFSTEIFDCYRYFFELELFVAKAL